MRNNRIAMILPELGGGGAERVFLLLARSLATTGIDVDLLLLKKRGEYLSLLSKDIRIIPLTNNARQGIGPFELTGALIRLIIYLKKNNIDALLSTLSRTNLFAVCAWKLSGSRCRMILREANTLHNIHNKGLRLLMSWIYPWANHIIAISKGVAADMQSLGIKKKNISVIYNPVDIAAVQKLSQEPSGHPWLSDKSVPVITAVGRLVPQKDFDTLITAFSKALKQRDLYLLILGSGPLRAPLQKKINALDLSGAVDLVGFQDNPFAYIKASDLLVMSSRWEGFGMVLIEALACGVNIVSTDCHSGPSEILENGRYGTLVPVGDSDRLAKAILATLDKPLAKSILLHRAAFFAKEKIVQQYTQVIWPS